MNSFNNKNGHATIGRNSIFSKGRTSKSKKYQYAKKSQIPKGVYNAKIDAFARSRSNAGDDAHDVSCTLTDSTGKQYFMKNRIVDDSRSMDNFLDAVFDAGLPEGSSERDVIGIELQVTVSYSPGSTYGDVAFSAKPNVSFPSATKKIPAVASVEDEDDEDLDEDDENFDEDDDDDYIADDDLGD